MDLTGMTTVSFSSRALQAERGNRAIICSFLMLHAGSATQVLRCCQLCPKNNCALHTEPGTLKVCCLNKHRGQMKPCLLRLVAPMGSFYTLCHTATPGLKPRGYWSAPATKYRWTLFTLWTGPKELEHQDTNQNPYGILLCAGWRY